MKAYLAGLVLLSSAAISPVFARSFPEAKLPAHIKAVTDSGERPDWSLDGKRILFLNRSGGEVYEVEVATKKVKLIAKAPAGQGCWRALYLANGDYFFTAGTGRRSAYAYILDSGRTRPAVRINTVIQEGPAISRTRLRISYTSDMSRIRLADIVYTGGTPAFANDKVIIDKANVMLDGTKISSGSIEPQSFRPSAEDEITFTAYGYGAGEGFLYNTVTGRITNFTQDTKCYEEPEGIFPDGQFSLVESNRHVCTGGLASIDVYRYSLSDPAKWVRLTHFHDVAPFKSSNPVVRDDGKFFAFMESRSDVEAGVGFGIYVFDLVASGHYSPPPVAVKGRAGAAPSSRLPEEGPSGTGERHDMAGRAVRDDSRSRAILKIRR